MNIGEKFCSWQTAFQRRTAELKFENLKVFPLPVKDQLNLQGLEGFTNISLFNNLGQKVLDLTIEELAETTLNIGYLGSGVFFLHLSDGQTASIFKIIKE